MTDSEKRVRTGAGVKLAGQWALLASIAYVLVEGLVFASYSAVTGNRFSDPLLADLGGGVVQPAFDQREVREGAGLGFKDPLLSLHPFLGYVYTPRGPGDEPIAVPISVDGFLDDRPMVRQRRDDVVLVGLIGGSVAGQLGTRYSEPLVEYLAELPEVKGRQIELVRLGMPGYHQPQQMIQLILMLVQGGELDLLLNIDGFNEIAVPAALNLPKDSHPLFPMNWSMVALDSPDVEQRRLIGAIEFLRQDRVDRATRFAESAVSWSPLAKLVWKLKDRSLERASAGYAWELQQLANDDLPYFIHGPEWSRAPDGGLIPWLVDVWIESSLQMKSLCDANGIRYAHFLQPNQYVPGSKALSREERSNAYASDSPYKGVVEEGYPLLRAAGVKLRTAGVEFHDLSELFRDVGETLYVDSCCHYNAQGNRLLASAIYRALSD